MSRLPRLSSLRIFLQVARTGSFSEAAKLHNLSQPALSRAVRALEDELGAKLFDRTTRTVALTPAGEELLPVAKRLTTDLDQAMLELSESFSGRRGRVIIGALPSIAATTLPGIISNFKRSYPDVDVVLRDGLSEILYRQLESREVDFVLSTPPQSAASFHFRPLFEDACVAVCRSGELGKDRDPIGWTVFTDRPFIAMALDSSVRRLTDSAFLKAQLAVKPLFECAQLTTMGGLISAGLGITAVPLSTLPLMGNGAVLEWRPLTGPRSARLIGMAQLAGRSLSPAGGAMWRCCEQSLASAPYAPCE